MGARQQPLLPLPAEQNISITSALPYVLVTFWRPLRSLQVFEKAIANSSVLRRLWTSLLDSAERGGCVHCAFVDLMSTARPQRPGHSLRG